MTQLSTDSQIKTELFGNFISTFPPEHDSLELSFTPSSRPIKQRWRSNRLSAHFFADYFINFLPVEDNEPNQEQRIKESKSAVSYVANELLENAMKFNDDSSHYKVKFGIHFLNDNDSITAVIFSSNSIKPGGEDKLREFIAELLASDPHEMYVRQIEKSAEEEGTSGLGLLTMINDYSAKI
ncbi:MAG: ATP-binding protein, partial [Nostoc sp. TH1S01]|nr:ATP-binding protein [Nostoc sp. TH1S01]